MKSKMKYVLFAASLLFLSWWFWPRMYAPMVEGGVGQSVVDAGRHSSGSEKTPADPSVGGKMDTERLRATVSSVQQLRKTLGAADDATWVANYPILMQLPALDLYRLLTQPELVMQPQAERLLNLLQASCAIAIAELDVGVASDSYTSQPLNREWCRELVAARYDGVGQQSPRQDNAPTGGAALDATAFADAQLGRMNGTESAELKATLAEQSKVALRTSGDPFLLQRALDNLFDEEDPSVIPDSAAWQRLPHSQQSYVRLAAGALASCEAVRNCGPGSLVMNNYCSMVPGVNCQPGMSLMQVAQNSLSANQWNVLNGILNEVRRQRSLPAGP